MSDLLLNYSTGCILVIVYNKRSSHRRVSRGCRGCRGCRGSGSSTIGPPVQRIENGGDQLKAARAGRRGIKS